LSKWNAAIVATLRVRMRSIAGNAESPY